MPKSKTLRSDRVIAFIENLKVPSGKGRGGPFLLRDWQKAFIRDVYDPIDPEDGRRLVRQAILSIARKNGKTALAAALVLVHIVGPESIENGELYSAANDQKQAAAVFKFCRQFITADPELADLLIVTPSTKTIGCPANGSVYQAVSAEAGTKHGLNPSFIIYDELAQSKEPFDLLEALETSQGARAIDEEPLFLTISTQSHDPTHRLSQMIDAARSGTSPEVVCHLYAAPDDADFEDEEAWAAANPALDDFCSRKFLRTYAKSAREIPSKESSFRNLHMNQRVSPHTPLISLSQWLARGPQLERGTVWTQKDAFQFEPKQAVYLGLDLSYTTDLTALAILSADGSRVKTRFWKPGALIAEHSKSDDKDYETFARQGWLDLTPGKSIDMTFIAKAIKDLCAEYNVLGLALDPNLSGELLRLLDDQGVTTTDKKDSYALRVVKWGTYPKAMEPAIRAVEHAVLQEELEHDGNPLMTFCMMNAQVYPNADGHRRFDKSASRFRIDGAIAMAIAFGLRAQDIQEPIPTNPFSNPDFVYEAW